LAVARIAISPLRDRPRDILPLARHFIDLYAARSGHPANTPPPTLTEDAQRRLLTHPWRGNIRELENAIHHALLVCQDGRVTADDLPASDGRTGALPERPTQSTMRAVPAAASAPPSGLDEKGALPRAELRDVLRALYREGGGALWDEIEETVIRTAYEHAGFNQLRTARLLGLTRSVVRARLLQFGAIDRAGAPSTGSRPLAR